MKRIFISVLILSISILCFTQSDTIKAKIAILHKAGEIYSPLRTRDRLRVGEMLRIFVLPGTDCFAYVIHTGNEKSTLLGKQQIEAAKDTLILPNPFDFYIFDEAGTKEKIAIICSSEKISEIENLFKKSENISALSWKSVEEKIVTKNKPKLSETSEKPFPMAGNVSAVNEDFIETMNFFEGEKLIIRKYEIEVKK